MTIDAAKSVTATFSIQQFVLSLQKAGNGGGTVTSAPAGIGCGASCQASFDSGTSVTLAQSAGNTSVFTGWSGACSGAGSCTVTMDAAKSVTATFSLPIHALDVTKPGAGLGTVTSTPTGIDCGADCTEGYTAGTSVTLAAASAPGSLFTGWTGACTGTGPCTVIMGAATSVGATFAMPRFALSVAADGSGTGTVTSSTGAIACGPNCIGVYDVGAVVSLSQAPSPGSTFVSWRGACSGSGACSVTMDAAKSVYATFGRQQFALTASRGGGGEGVVTSSPAGIHCGATCSAPFAIGTPVGLTATPAAGSVFSGWGGACSGTGACNVGMNAANGVSATFTMESGADSDDDGIPNLVESAEGTNPLAKDNEVFGNNRLVRDADVPRLPRPRGRRGGDRGLDRASSARAPTRDCRSSTASCAPTSSRASWRPWRAFTSRPSCACLISRA